MIEELVKYWEGYKAQTPMVDTGDIPKYHSRPHIEGFMEYLSDKFKKDEKE